MVPGVVLSGVFGGLAGLGWSLIHGHGPLATVLAYPGVGLLWVTAFVAIAELRRVASGHP